MFVSATCSYADECDALAAKIVATTGADFDRRVNQNIHFTGKTPIDAISIDCGGPGSKKSVGVFSNKTSLPQSIFIDVTGTISEVSLGISASKIKSSALKCQQLALRDKDGDAEFDERGYQMTCTVRQASRGLQRGDQGSIGFVIYKMP
ncbi:hypothetical protein [Methylobacterium indicum]|uniref:hypothetical protein n=1 Tax=Methylobacterium indicum TaxID=1775910 RepID=UPI00104280E0|nr:hypothetical protein [Methylobacterium indicum]